MAQGHAAVFSTIGHGRAASRNIRLTVLVSVVLICGSFAAAAVLQMRNDRMHALAQAEYFEARRAGDVAAAAGASLDRIAALGRAFADGRGITDAAKAAGIENITVFDRTGLALKSLPGMAAMTLASNALRSRGPMITAPATMIFTYAGRVVAIAFDPGSLVPMRMLERAALTLPGEIVLIQDVNWGGTGAAVPVAGWPVMVQTSVDESSALRAWTGSLPLYLFVILGPALVGAGLAVVFVQEFERRARANAAVRSLRATRPVEAKLLVRLAQAELRAVEDARAKSEFIAHMSHELRTPLNAIIGFSEVIERGLYGPVGHAKYVEYAHDINDSGRALHSKIGDILEFANIEAGRYRMEPSLIDVSQIVADCVHESAGRAFSRRIALNLGFAVPLEALADPIAVKRIITNLLSNALLYTQEGGQVSLDVHEEEGAAVVSVSDNGSGFTRAEAMAAGIAFRRYERPGRMTGVGVGLTIAMALARRMGGAVSIGGPAGEGTVAVLRLPKPPIATRAFADNGAPILRAGPRGS
jgi:signal transduction histidine kinase